MIKDANITQDDIADSVSILSVTFITLQPFSTAIGRRIGPKYWIACMMVAWGTVCMAHAATKNRGSLIALRLLLGAFEAGFVPTSFVSTAVSTCPHRSRLILKVLHVDYISQILTRSPLGPVCGHVLDRRCVCRPHCLWNLSDQACFAAQLAAAFHH
jgi:MFS family permease